MVSWRWLAVGALATTLGLSLLTGPACDDGGGAGTCTESACRAGDEACCPGAVPGVWNPVLHLCVCPSGGDGDADATTDGDDAGTTGSCAAPTPLECDDVLSGQTTGGSSSAFGAYDGCGSTLEESGPERVFLVRVTERRGVIVSLTPTDGQDADLFVLADSCATASCVGRSVAGLAGDAETLAFTAEPERDYFVVVDGFRGAEGAFDIAVTCGDPEICDNAIDDDGDTLIDCCGSACWRHPACDEVCNGLDDDCDGSVDDGAGCGDCSRESYDGRSYLFCTTPATWTDAAEACLGWGYRLTAIGDAVEDTWLDVTARGEASGGWWVGGVQGTEAGCAEPADCWRWGNGEPMSYTNWFAGQPNEAGTPEDCLLLGSGATPGWADARCEETHPYVCEQDCFPESNGGHDYLFCIGNWDWVGAREECFARGHHLVTIDDEAEDTWLGETAAGYRSSSWWIGLNDRDTEGTWAWVSGTSSYTSWCDGQPDDHLGNEDCATILWSCTRPANWNDYSCSNWLPYVCERP